MVLTEEERKNLKLKIKFNYNNPSHKNVKVDMVKNETILENLSSYQIKLNTKKGIIDKVKHLRVVNTESLNNLLES